MSRHVRSGSIWEALLQDEESWELVGPVLVLLPSDEQPPQVEPATLSQEITPGQDDEDETAPEVQDPDPEADLQELALANTGREGKVKGPDLESGVPDLAPPNTGDEGGEGPDVMEDIFPKRESIYMPEAVRSVHAVTDDQAAVGKTPPLSVVSFITAILRESL